MSRDIPANYVEIDQDRSFVIGTGAIEANTGAVPASGGDVAANVRHLYGHAHAGHWIAQVFETPIDQTVAALTQVTMWRVVAEDSFTDLEIQIDYDGRFTSSGAFSLECVETGKTKLIPSRNVAAARDSVVVDWTDSDVHLQHGNLLTFRLHCLGDGLQANTVHALYLRRKPRTADMLAGLRMDGAHPSTDSAQWVDDAPVTPDKAADILNGLSSLDTERRKTHAVWSLPTGHTPAGAEFAGLLPLGEFNYIRAAQMHLTAENATTQFNGNPEETNALYITEVPIVGYDSDSVIVNLAPVRKLLSGAQEIGQFRCSADYPGQLYTLTIEGI